MDGLDVDLFMFISLGGQDQEYVMYGIVDLDLSIGMFIIVDIFGGLIINIEYKQKYQQWLRKMET